MRRPGIRFFRIFVFVFMIGAIYFIGTFMHTPISQVFYTPAFLKWICLHSANTLFPSVSYEEDPSENEADGIIAELCAKFLFPVASQRQTALSGESTLTALGETVQASENNAPSAQPPAATQPSDTQQPSAVPTEEPAAEASATGVLGIIPNQTVKTGQTYALSDLNYSFLLNQFFTLDPTTAIDESLLNASSLLEKDLHLERSDAPQILIYHTHSQETFVDSVEGDPSTSIVGVGDYLTSLLTNVYGYNVIHDTSTYDLIDGELDRNRAYSLALDSVEQILEQNPSIEIIIDLHRDGIEGNKMTTFINNQETARIMFFNGLSRTAKNGAIDYLYNPYISDNLAFSLQLQLKAAEYFPGFTRPIYLKSYRYNLHLRPRSLLVEAGSQKNTLQEELNAMEVLAELLHMVLQ